MGNAKVNTGMNVASELIKIIKFMPSLFLNRNFEPIFQATSLKYIQFPKVEESKVTNDSSISEDTNDNTEPKDKIIANSVSEETFQKPINDTRIWIGASMYFPNKYDSCYKSKSVLEQENLAMNYIYLKVEAMIQYFPLSDEQKLIFSKEIYSDLIENKGTCLFNNSKISHNAFAPNPKLNYEYTIEDFKNYLESFFQKMDNHLIRRFVGLLEDLTEEPLITQQEQINKALGYIRTLRNSSNYLGDAIDEERTDYLEGLLRGEQIKVDVPAGLKEEPGKKQNPIIKKSKLKWNPDKTHLIELITALWESEVIYNDLTNKKATQEELFLAFSVLFNVEFKVVNNNYSALINCTLRGRNADREIIFIPQLQEALVNFINKKAESKTKDK